MTTGSNPSRWTEVKSRWRKTLVAVQAASPDTYCADSAAAEDLEKETPIGQGLFTSWKVAGEV